MQKNLIIPRFLHVPKLFNGDFHSLPSNDIFLGEANVGDLIHMHCLGRVTVVVDLSGIVPTSLEEAQSLLREQIKLDEAKLATKKEELAAIKQTIREIGNAEG